MLFLIESLCRFAWAFLSLQRNSGPEHYLPLETVGIVYVSSERLVFC